MVWLGRLLVGGAVEGGEGVEMGVSPNPNDKKD